MSWQAVKWALEQTHYSPTEKIKPTEKLVLVAIGYHCDESGRNAFPSLSTLSKKTALTRRAIYKSTKKLEAAEKLMVRRSKKTSGDFDHNVYELPIEDREPSSLGVENDIPHGREYSSLGGEPGSLWVGNDVQEVGNHVPPNSPLKSPKKSPETNPPADGGVPVLVSKNGKGRNSYPEDFETFYSLYPRQIEKHPAFKAWCSTLKRKAATPDELIAAAKHYQVHVRKRDDNKVKYPATFLGPGEPWRDYVNSPPAEKSHMEKWTESVKDDWKPEPESPQKAEVKKLGKDQCARIHYELNCSNLKDDDLKPYLEKEFGINEIRDIAIKDYESVILWIKKNWRDPSQQEDDPANQSREKYEA